MTTYSEEACPFKDDCPDPDHHHDRLVMDDELRKKVCDVIIKHERVLSFLSTNSPVVDDFVELIAQERAKAAREARLSDNHDWDAEMFKSQDVIVCRRCATTFRARGNKPCKGKMAKIGLRLQSQESGGD